MLRKHKCTVLSATYMGAVSGRVMWIEPLKGAYLVGTAEQVELLTEEFERDSLLLAHSHMAGRLPALGSGLNFLFKTGRNKASLVNVDVDTGSLSEKANFTDWKTCAVSGEYLWGATVEGNLVGVHSMSGREVHSSKFNGTGHFRRIRGNDIEFSYPGKYYRKYVLIRGKRVYPRFWWSRFVDFTRTVAPRLQVDMYRHTPEIYDRWYGRYWQVDIDECISAVSRISSCKYLIGTETGEVYSIEVPKARFPYALRL